MGVGVAVGVAVGVLVSVAVLVGAVVAVGKGVALGAGVDVGADTGAQADSIKLTSKNTSNVGFILRVLLWRSAAQRPAPQPPRSERKRAKRSAGSACWAGFFSFFVTHNNFKKSSTSSRACFKICANVERLTGRWAGTVILSTSLPMRFCNRM
jgi:hypothetical protein